MQTRTATHVFLEGRRHHDTRFGIYPGVTTILNATANKYGLEKWKQTVGHAEAERISQESRQFGDLVHNNIQSTIEGKVINDCVAAPLMEFVRSLEQVVACEFAVSHPAGFAGSVDCLAVVDGVLTVIDWKTSRKRKVKSQIKDYFLQVAAYRACYEFEFKENVRSGLVCVFNRADNRLQKFPMSQDDLSDAWSAFQKRLQMYYELYPMEF